MSEAEADVSDMVELDQKSKKRLEKVRPGPHSPSHGGIPHKLDTHTHFCLWLQVRDMVLFRYGSTGVWAAIQVSGPASPQESARTLMMYPYPTLVIPT